MDWAAKAKWGPESTQGSTRDDWLADYERAHAQLHRGRGNRLEKETAWRGLAPQGEARHWGQPESQSPKNLTCITNREKLWPCWIEIELNCPKLIWGPGTSKQRAICSRQKAAISLLLDKRSHRDRLKSLELVGWQDPESSGLDSELSGPNDFRPSKEHCLERTVNRRTFEIDCRDPNWIATCCFISDSK